jgi:hypothetical protein
MKFTLAAAILAWARIAPATAAKGDHPVGKIIELLKDLKDKVKTQGGEEDESYAKFRTWCGDSLKTLDKAIEESKEKITVLEIKIESKTKEEALLEKEIQALGEHILTETAEGEKADEIRQEAADAYTQADKDLESSVKAIGEAVTAMEGAKDATASFVQVKFAKLIQLPLILEQLSEGQIKALGGKISEEPKAGYDEMFAGGDFQHSDKTYDFKGDDIIKLLKTLKTKFEDDRVDGTNQETASTNAYNLAKDARDGAIQAAKDTKSEKNTLLGEVQEALNEAKSDLKDTQDDLKADSDTQSDTTQSCDMKATEYKQRVELRGNEIKAMEAAMEIMAKVTNVRTEAPENVGAPPSPLEAGLVQAGMAPPKSVIVSDGHPAAASADPKQRAVALLRSVAKQSHSRKLMQFAKEVAAHMGGPFDEINNMIQKMIFRLMAEQTSEDNHKQWCDLEMSRTNTTKTEKEEKIERLTLKIEDQEASIEALKNEIREASDMVATIDEHVAEATEIREEGKRENKEALDDSKSAQAALAKAIAVLEDFYKDSGAIEKEAWELLQQKKGPVELGSSPDTWGASYTGAADPNAQPGGIVAMLKSTAADFAQMEADTEAQEFTDAKAFGEEMKSCAIEKARRAKEAEVKEQEQKRTEAKVASYKKALKLTDNELSAAKQYWKDLGPACMDGDSSYEERKGDRDMEISGLKEAQVILQDAFEGGPAPAPAASFLAPVHRK